MDENDLDEYISNQEGLIKLDYALETKEKQKTKIENVVLFFNLQSNNWSKKENTRIWTTTLPLPKNLIPPEYLIMNDPTYVNVSDKIIIYFLDDSKDPIEGSVVQIANGELKAVFKLDWDEDSARHACTIQFLPNDVVFKRKLKALESLERLNDDLKNMLCGIYPKKPITKKNNFKFTKKIFI